MKGVEKVELLTYWKIIWRHLWIVVIVVAIVTLYVGYSAYKLHKVHTYSSAVTVQIGVSATATKTYSNADDISVSESLADAFATGPIFTSSQFDNAIYSQIIQDSGAIAQKFGANPDLGDCNTAGAIGAALSAARTHSLVTITDTCSTPAGAWAVANAVGEVTVGQIGYYLDYLVNNNATLATFNPSQADISARIISSVSDPATIAALTSSKIALYAALLVVALAIGLALAFFLEYMDDRIREQDQAANLLGLPILGNVPGAPMLGRK
jgi:capsular polysaccharide biosynthesis protein